MRIVLVGYMGCGKTTVGKRLGLLTGLPFIDSDDEIEALEQRTITSIFADEGEAYFRNLETQYLVSLNKSKKDFILSTGGGMPVREENRKLLKELGRVVYLKADADTIYAHVKSDTKRPLLQCDNPLLKIQTMLKEREPAYMETADVVIDTAGKDIEEVLSMVTAAIGMDTCK